MSQKPIVLVVIDENSRVRVLQDGDVQVITVDRRTDGDAVFWPRAAEYPDMLAILSPLKAISPGSDDFFGSARAAIRRIRSGLSVVAGSILMGAK